MKLNTLTFDPNSSTQATKVGNLFYNIKQSYNNERKKSRKTSADMSDDTINLNEKNMQRVTLVKSNLSSTLSLRSTLTSDQNIAPQVMVPNSTQMNSQSTLNTQNYFKEERLPTQPQAATPSSKYAKWITKKVLTNSLMMNITKSPSTSNFLTTDASNQSNDCRDYLYCKRVQTGAASPMKSPPLNNSLNCSQNFSASQKDYSILRNDENWKQEREELVANYKNSLRICEEQIIFLKEMNAEKTKQLEIYEQKLFGYSYASVRLRSQSPKSSLGLSKNSTTLNSPKSKAMYLQYQQAQQIGAIQNIANMNITEYQLQQCHRRIQQLQAQNQNYLNQVVSLKSQLEIQKKQHDKHKEKLKDLEDYVRSPEGQELGEFCENREKESLKEQIRHLESYIQVLQVDLSVQTHSRTGSSISSNRNQDNLLSQGQKPIQNMTSFNTMVTQQQDHVQATSPSLSNRHPSDNKNQFSQHKRVQSNFIKSSQTPTTTLNLVGPSEFSDFQSGSISGSDCKKSVAELSYAKITPNSQSNVDTIPSYDDIDSVCAPLYLRRVLDKNGYQDINSHKKNYLFELIPAENHQLLEEVDQVVLIVGPANSGQSWIANSLIFGEQMARETYQKNDDVCSITLDGKTAIIQLNKQKWMTEAESEFWTQTLIQLSDVLIIVVDDDRESDIKLIDAFFDQELRKIEGLDQICIVHNYQNFKDEKIMREKIKSCEETFTLNFQKLSLKESEGINYYESELTNSLGKKCQIIQLVLPNAYIAGQQSNFLGTELIALRNPQAKKNFLSQIKREILRAQMITSTNKL